MILGLIGLIELMLQLLNFSRLSSTSHQRDCTRASAMRNLARDT